MTPLPRIASNPYRAGEPQRPCAACDETNGMRVYRAQARPLCERCAGVWAVGAARTEGHVAERLAWRAGLFIGFAAGAFVGLSLAVLVR